MNNKILSQLSFGFELEGAFSQKLYNKLDGIGSFKEDGSVDSSDEELPKRERTYVMLERRGVNVQGESEGRHECGECNGDGGYREDCECDGETNCSHSHTEMCETERTLEHPIQRHDNCSHDCVESDCPVEYPCSNDDDYHWVRCDYCDGDGNTGSDNELVQEYASEIFTEFEKFQAVIEMFDDKNYASNRTCGFHFHIGMKPEAHFKKLTYKNLWNAVGNLAFLKALYDEACTWCPCQKKRLCSYDDHYYQFWKNPYDFISTYNRKYQFRNFNGDASTKFRFLHFHNDFSTLEFRFLSPCKHKAANAEKLLSYLTDYLASNDIIQASEDVPQVASKQHNVDLIKQINSERKYVCAT